VLANIYALSKRHSPNGVATDIAVTIATPLGLVILGGC
jgi:hypothetical protein